MQNIILFLLWPYRADPDGPEDQDQDQQGKGKNIFIVTGDIAGGKGFGQAEDEAAQNRTGNGADSTKHCGCKGLDAGNETDVKIYLTDMRGDQTDHQ